MKRQKALDELILAQALTVVEIGKAIRLAGWNNPPLSTGIVKLIDAREKFEKIVDKTT